MDAAPARTGMSSATITAPRKRTLGARRAELVRAAEHALFGLVPVVATLALVAYQFKLHAVALDFHAAYYPAVRRLLEGLSPYAATHGEIVGGTSFVYPAVSAVLLAPFALASKGVAEVLYMLVCMACVPAILRTLRVRDWRLYGVAMLWFPVFDGWQSGNVTLPLTLMIALAWRHRDRPLVVGLVTAAAVSIKPFVWPLGLWLLATRRWKAAAWAFASGAAFNLVTWAVVVFGQLNPYLQLSTQHTDALWKGGYSMLAVANHLGFGRGVGEGLLLTASGCAAAVVIHLGTIKRRQRDALIVAILLMLLASPLLWAHYFSLLLVPLALRRPRLSPVWALPVLMWPMPPRQPVYGWQECLAWGLTAICLTVALTNRGRRQPRPRWRSRTSPDAPAGRRAAGVARADKTPGNTCRRQSDREIWGRSAARRVLDWAMASARPDLSHKSLTRLRPELDRCRVLASWSTTSMGSRQLVQDNESTDPPLSRDGKI